MFCQHCGNEIAAGDAFCAYCGKPVINNRQQQTYRQQGYSEQNNNYSDSSADYREYYADHKHEAKKNGRKETSDNKTAMLWVCVTVLALIACVLLTIVIIDALSDEEKETNSSDAPPITERADKSAPKPTKMPVVTPAPVFNRTRLYNSAYTYKDYGDIHSSVESSDETAFEIEEVIHDFNEAWIDFINEYDMRVYDYLRDGTSPYGYAKKYEEKTLSQNHELLEVMDVRQTDGYYYAWVHEIINQYDYNTDVESNLEYHWIYKIGNDSDGYYIAHYVRDPAFNK